MLAKAWWDNLEEHWKRLFSVNHVIHHRWEQSALKEHKLVVGNPFDYYWSIVQDKFNHYPTINNEIYREMVNLPHFYAADSNLNTLSPLAVCQKLETIDVSENKISDCEVLSNKTHLKQINASSNVLDNLDFCRYLPALETLLVRENHIRDLGTLCRDAHDTLKVLDISYSELDNPKQLAQLTRLEELYYSCAGLVSASFITALRHLKTLDVSFNEINDVSFCFDLPQIEYLDLYQNPFKKDAYDWFKLEEKGVTIVKEDEDTGLVIDY